MHSWGRCSYGRTRNILSYNTLQSNIRLFHGYIWNRKRLYWDLHVWLLVAFWEFVNMFTCQSSTTHCYVHCYVHCLGTYCWFMNSIFPRLDITPIPDCNTYRIFQPISYVPLSTTLFHMTDDLIRGSSKPDIWMPICVVKQISEASICKTNSQMITNSMCAARVVWIPEQ